MNIKLTIEYDGTNYHGWQVQSEGETIQSVLEKALSTFFGSPTRLIGSGRTDAGVHALGQVAHLDLADDKPLDTLRAALNYHLKPQPIAVVEAEPAPVDFHARFSATWRRYRYRILNRRAPPAFDRGRVWHVPVPLDDQAMTDAAQVLVGRHDFNSFRSASCQAA